jgi:hypothetical protein
MKIIQDDTALPANDQENGQQNRPRSLPTTSQLISCGKKKSDLKIEDHSRGSRPTSNKNRSSTKEHKKTKIPAYLILVDQQKSDIVSNW